MKKLGNGYLKELGKRMDTQFDLLSKNNKEIQKRVGKVEVSLKALQKETRGLLKYIEFIDREFQLHRHDKWAHENLPSR